MFKIFINYTLNKLTINRAEFVHTEKAILSVDILYIAEKVRLP